MEATLSNVLNTICPECGQKVNITYGLYSLKGHKKKCSYAGKRYVSPETNGKLEEPELKEQEEPPDEYELAKPFFPYQKQVFDWAKDKAKVGFLLEMRLGKTLISIRWAKNRVKKNPNIKRILILCPKIVIPVWLRELEEQGISPLQINPKASRQLNQIVATLPGWYVTNYECVTATDLDQMKWDLVILDESNYIKAPEPKITRKLIGTYKPERRKEETDEEFESRKKSYINYFPDVPEAAILTGTPAPETLLDYYNQMKFLGVNLYGAETYYEFRNKFFQLVAPNKYQPWPYLKEVLAGEVAKHCYVLKRDQVGMGSHKVYEQMYVDFDDNDYKEQYEALEALWMNESHETEWAIVAINYLQQFAGGFPKKGKDGSEPRSYHKLKELKRLVFDSELQKDSIVIWCRYREEVKAIREALHKEETCYSIYGDTDSGMRQRFIDTFQEGKFRLLVNQIRTARMGVDLAKADTAIYFSNSYSATDRLQSEDRIIHPQKKSPVLYIDLMTQNTIDSIVYELLKDKTLSQEEFMEKIIKILKAKAGK